MDVGGLIALTIILIVVIPIAILIVIDKIRERKSNWTKEEKMMIYSRLEGYNSIGDKDRCWITEDIEGGGADIFT